MKISLPAVLYQGILQLKQLITNYNQGIKMNRSYRRFTLVEMLTVIAIISILAGLVIPIVIISRQRGRETQAKSDVSALVSARHVNVRQLQAMVRSSPVKPVSSMDTVRYMVLLSCLASTISRSAGNGDARWELTGPAR